MLLNVMLCSLVIIDAKPPTGEGGNCVILKVWFVWQSAMWSRRRPQKKVATLDPNRSRLVYRAVGCENDLKHRVGSVARVARGCRGLVPIPAVVRMTQGKPWLIAGQSHDHRTVHAVNINWQIPFHWAIWIHQFPYTYSRCLCTVRGSTHTERDNTGRTCRFNKNTSGHPEDRTYNLLIMQVQIRHSSNLVGSPLKHVKPLFTHCWLHTACTHYIFS